MSDSFFSNTQKGFCSVSQKCQFNTENRANNYYDYFFVLPNVFGRLDGAHLQHFVAALGPCFPNVLSLGFQVIRSY